MSLKAVAAIHRTALGGLEGNLGGAAALVAHNLEHLAGTTAGTTGSTASGAAAGLVLEAFLSEESLLVSGEYEFLTTLFAH